MARQHLAVERGQQLHVGGVEVAVSERLDDEPCRHARLAEAAVSLRQVDADEAEPAHLAHQLALNAAVLLARLVARRQPLAGEALRRLDERALLVCQVG
jgi:hypothetical protein